jgi:hypothetical protein
MFEEIETTHTYDSMLGVWNSKKGEPVYKSPEQVGLMKKTNLTILFQETRPNPRKFRSIETVWFKEQKEISVREDREHIWLLWDVQSKKLFIKDLMFGVTFQCPLKTNADIIVSDLTEEPEFLSIKQVKDLIEGIAVNSPLLIFTKKEESGDYGIGVESR